MKPVIRFQSQLLFRKSYKPAKIYRPASRTKPLVFRPARSSLRTPPGRLTDLN
jgi:hypothetical protein